MKTYKFPMFAASVVAMLLSSASSYAKPGDLDATFNAGASNPRPGTRLSRLRMTFDTGFHGSFFDPQGRSLILLDGTPNHIQYDQKLGIVHQYTLARLNADGSPDASLGKGKGRALLSPMAERFDIEVLGADNQGRIYAGGQRHEDGQRKNGGAILVARYNPDGSRDLTYGNSKTGVAAFYLDGNKSREEDDNFEGMFVYPDGRVLVLGYPFSDKTIRMGTARLLPTGKLDPSYGTGGISLQPTGEAQETLEYHGLTVDKSDRVLAVASSNRPKAGGGWVEGTMAWRLTPAGALDTSFNGKGCLELKGRPAPSSFCVDDSGRMVIVGILAFDNLSAKNPGGCWLIRLTKNGTVDETFGVKGTFRAAVGTRQLVMNEILRDRSGNFVIQGTWPSAKDEEIQEVVLLRVSPEGKLDASFGKNGWVAYTFQLDGETGSAPLTSTRLDEAGRIVTVSWMYFSNSIGTDDFGVARVLN